MNRKQKRLPPLSSLRGFEAAARLSSFSKAASELHMTQSAISHQRKLLEEFFGQPLFTRVNRAVELTDAGADFLNTTAKALEVLDQGVSRLEFYKKPGSVVINTTPAFASKWLLPKLKKLTDDLPEIEPWIHTTTTHDFTEHSETDLSIWYGHGDWPGFECVKLFNDAVTPMCSPDLLERQGALNTHEDLHNHRLIHVEQVERREDWEAWASLSEMEGFDTVSGSNFSDTGLALDAAIAGQGIVLSSTVLAHQHLKDGTLVRPFDLALPTEQNYYLICRAEQLQQESVRQLFEWLSQQAITSQKSAQA